MTDDPTHDEVLNILGWYQAFGVDAVLDEIPVDWLARGNLAPGQGYVATDREARSPRAPVRDTAPAPDVGRRPRPQTPLALSEAETEARRAARQAATLDLLEAALKNFDGCSLRATATNLCFFRGAPDARVMIVGEAPGRDEDLEGRPFVGRAGQLLDKMLAAISLTERDVHITNVVYWRPPGNRTPTPQETLACRPFLERQMELVNPDLMIALGGAAAKELFGVTDGIMRLRGKWREIEIGGRKVPAIATLHPAYLLRTPAAKELAWRDLLQIRARLFD